MAGSHGNVVRLSWLPATGNGKISDLAEWCAISGCRREQSEWASAQEGQKESLIRKNERERLNLAIEALPVVFREALILREIEDMSYENIAEIMQAPLGTVMSRLHRARALLRRALGGVALGTDDAN